LAVRRLRGTFTPRRRPFFLQPVAPLNALPLCECERVVESALAPEAVPRRSVIVVERDSPALASWQHFVSAARARRGARLAALGAAAIPHGRARAGRVAGRRRRRRHGCGRVSTPAGGGAAAPRRVHCAGQETVQ
jgi:hypothetical protein